MKYMAIILLAVLLVLPASASDENNITILSWSPQVVDHVYVNETAGRTITYSLTTSLPMEVNDWALDGVPVSGVAGKNTVSYLHTWDSRSAGFHTLTYSGSVNRSQISFRWYVNVYDAERKRGGNILDVIDDTVENHAADVRIGMLKYTISKYGSNSDITIQRVNRLYDEIAGQQNTKYRAKLAKAVMKIAREDLNDEGLAGKFEKVSEAGDHQEIERKESSGKDKGKGKGPARDNTDNKKKSGGSADETGKSGGESPGNSGGPGSSGNQGNSGSSGNAGDEGNGGGNSGNSGSSGDGGHSGNDRGKGKSDNKG